MFNELVHTEVNEGMLFFLDDKDNPILLIEIRNGDYPIILNSEKRILRAIKDYGLTIKEIKTMIQLDTRGEISVFFAEA